MLKEKQEADFIDVKRLGVTFEKESILRIYKNLDEAELPIIPYNASVDELNRIIEQTARLYAYYQDAMGMFKVEERKQERMRNRLYSKAYRDAERHVAGATQAILKMVAEATKEVAEADDALDEIRNKIDILDAKLKAFAVLDQDARKLLSSQLTTMSVGLD